MLLNVWVTSEALRLLRNTAHDMSVLTTTCSDVYHAQTRTSIIEIMNYIAFINILVEK